jgi:hypothetical protein
VTLIEENSHKFIETQPPSLPGGFPNHPKTGMNRTSMSFLIIGGSQFVIATSILETLPLPVPLK